MQASREPCSTSPSAQGWGQGTVSTGAMVGRFWAGEDGCTAVGVLTAWQLHTLHGSHPIAKATGGPEG